MKGINIKRLENSKKKNDILYIYESQLNLCSEKNIRLLLEFLTTNFKSLNLKDIISNKTKIVLLLNFCRENIEKSKKKNKDGLDWANINHFFSKNHYNYSNQLTIHDK